MSFFTFLSIFGVLVGVFLITQGLWGDGIGATLTLIIGIFVAVKEVMDMFFAGG